MRIRKNTKLSSLLSPHTSAQTHVCQLNQSPWDVIPFTSSSHPYHHQDPLLLYLPSSSSSSPLFQFEPEESLNGNGSLGGSMGAVESVASMERVDFMAVDNGEEMATDQKEPAIGVEEPSMAADRLRPKKAKPIKPNWTLPGSSGVKRTEKSCPTPAKRGRPRGSQGARRFSAAESNPHEFYYYSGFGPRWGKRRGDRGERGGSGGIESEGGGVIATNVDGCRRGEDELGSEKSIDLRETDYVEDEDDEEEEDEVEEEEEEEEEDGGGRRRRRTRKPVKARSLKSLM